MRYRFPRGAQVSRSDTKGDGRTATPCVSIDLMRGDQVAEGAQEARRHSTDEGGIAMRDSGGRLLALPLRVAILAAIGASLYLSSPALGWVGKLAYQACYSSQGRFGCEVPIHRTHYGTPLGTLDSVAVSPDGNSVYASGDDAGLVTRFKRKANGSLAYRDCVGPDENRCRGIGRLKWLGSVAVSPDGSFVYALAYRAVAVFRRSSDGALTYLTCVADGGRYGCQEAKHHSIGDPGDIAVSPDGRSVYVAAHHAITTLRRSPAGGLRYVDCLAPRREHRCQPMHAPPGATDVTVSPDGKSVYMTSFIHSSIAEFKRSRKGDLTFKGCIADYSNYGCRQPPHHRALRYVEGVDVSPDGQSLYAASYGGDSITTFARKANSTLTFKDCIANRGQAGCRRPPHISLASAQGVTVSPNGRSVYVPAYGDSLTTLSRARNGRLTYRDCFTNNGHFGCRRPGGRVLKGCYTAAVSPDGNSVYVGCDEGLTSFKRVAR